MTRKHRDDEQEVENITRNMKRNPVRESLRCDWENCGRLCKTQAGLKAHQQMAHREKIVTINCCKCVNSFSYHRVKQNHEELSTDTTRHMRILSPHVKYLKHGLTQEAMFAVQ